MNTIIISDLHLREDLTTFIHFCKKIAPKYKNIFILGDLFDLYLGDDLIEEYYQEIISLLSQLSTHSKVHIMFGNRDFLMGKEFCRQSQATLIAEPYIYENVVLLHGDSLVRDDWKYRLLKFCLRNPISIFISKHLPKTTRVALAKNIQQKAQHSKKNKPLEIMDINEEYCDKFMKRYYPHKHIIHGHTHRPHIHHKKDYTRYVLPSWEGRGKNIAGGIEIIHNQINTITFSK